jgi:hypothetical protein
LTVFSASRYGRCFFSKEAVGRHGRDSLKKYQARNDCSTPAFFDGISLQDSRRDHARPARHRLVKVADNISNQRMFLAWSWLSKGQGARTEQILLVE